MTAPAGPIGVVTGSRLEARCLQGHLRPDLIACSGADPRRARRQAAQLIERGARGLVSFGLAGALDPSLRPGDLLLPTTVLGPDDAAARPALLACHVDKGWRTAVDTGLGAGGLATRAGALLASERLIGSPADKAGLFQSTGAAAVDMESHAAAEAARTAGLPWLVLRAIADPADFGLPALVGAALRADGDVHLGAILRGIARRPTVLPALILLHRHSRRALASLARAVPLLAP